MTINMLNINREPFFVDRRNVQIIGVAGEAEHGKGTFCGILKNHQFEEVGFADPLKRVAKVIFGLSSHDVFTTQGKRRFHEYWGMTNREILQKIGDDAMKPPFGRDIWIKVWHKYMTEQFKNSGHDKYVISDLRFPEEIEYVVEMGGKIILINRPEHDSGLSEKEKSHSSEQYVKDMRKLYEGYQWFTYLENKNLSLHGFENRCTEVISQILKE